MRVALIDHYDSFSFNVIDWLTQGDLAVTYVAADDRQAMAQLAHEDVPLVLSPGPKRPEDYPETLALVRAKLGLVPMLGICLGHQMLGTMAGGRMVPALKPFHGSSQSVRLSHLPPTALLTGLPETFAAASYNSLVVQPPPLGWPEGWRGVAHNDLGELQALSYEPQRGAPAYGVQFHPESFLSDGAEVLRANWLAILRRVCA